MDSNTAINIILKFPRARRKYRECSHSIWDKHEEDALLRLLSKTYWRRVWIIQEILLARDLVVYCGSRRFSWSSLEALASELGENDRAKICWRVGCHTIRTSDGMKLHLERTLWNELPSLDRRLDLRELLKAHRDAECTDLRDRVFGLLSLASSGTKQISFKADYSIPVEALYIKILDFLHEGTAWRWNQVQIEKDSTLLRTIFKLDLDEPDREGLDRGEQS